MRKNATAKLIALLLVCAMILSVAACGGGGGSGGTATPGTSPSQSSSPSPGSSPDAVPADPDAVLNIQSTQDSGTLYPLGVTGGFLTVLYTFYETLYDTMSDGSRKWILATGLDRISDLQYTLTIREGVKFSNGNPLTAEDVMFSMLLCKDNPQFSLNVKVVDFEKTKVTGEYTIDLWYTEYNASQEPGFASLFVMDKESFDEASLSRNPIGTGPYVVVDYVTNSHLTLTAREGYWGEAPKIKNLNFKVINEEAQIVNALETGEIDMATIPITEADYVESLGYTVRIYEEGYAYSTMFSMSPGSPLETKEARWAVSHAIDRQAIVDVVFRGRSSVPHYPCSTAMTDFEERYNDLHETYSVGYDPVRAKELAEQSGLTGKKLRIITNGSPTFNTMAEIVQDGLLSIGVEAEIINHDQATYFGILMDESNFDIAIFNPLAPSMLAVDVLAMYLTFIPLGWTGPDRDLYGELSMGAITTYDEKARGDKLFDALEVFVEFDPWYGLCEAVRARAQSASLTGVEYTKAGMIYYGNIAFAE